MSDLGIESLEVDPIAGILQEETIEVSKDMCPLSKTSMDDIRAIQHGFKLPFSNFIMGLVIEKDEFPLVKGMGVDMAVIMGLRLGLSRFDHLERITMVIISLFKHK